MTQRPAARDDTRNKIVITLLVIGVLYLSNKWMSGEIGAVFSVLKNPRLQLFSILLTAILLEGVPFLLLGSCISGAIEVLVPRVWLEERIFPRKALPAAVVGSLLGMLFPVCSCGNIPVSRRLLTKGVPVAGVVGYLLAAPIINPITIFSTVAAFPGEKNIVLGRIILALIIAVMAGLILGTWKAERLFRNASAPVHCGHDPHHGGNRFIRVLFHAEHDFFLTGRYLIAGACVAALFQTFIPRAAVKALSANAVCSVVVMESLGILFSLCSFADAFVAATFTGLPPAAKIAFMVAGPMSGAALITLYMGTFERKFAVRLIACAAGGVLFLASAAAFLGKGGW